MILGNCFIGCVICVFTAVSQVRCFLGEDGDRWLMWYSGRSAGDPGLDAVAAAAGSIGALS